LRRQEQSQQEHDQATAAMRTRRQQQSQEEHDQHLQIRRGRQRLSRQQHSTERQRCQQLQARRTRHKNVALAACRLQSCSFTLSHDFYMLVENSFGESCQFKNSMSLPSRYF
jgi:hypothetical protein